jgi:hypothetical protein
MGKQPGEPDMTVAFKELAGSPVETYGPDGMKAERVLLCAWDDRELLVEQLLGDGYEFGGSGQTQYPDKPDVVAVRIRCEPLADDLAPQVLSELTVGLNRYHGFAKVRVDYQLLVPADRSDLPTIERGTFLTYRQESSLDGMTLPADALTWVGAPEVEVPEEAVPELSIPIVEHRLDWHRVTEPPWNAIRACIGTVNDAEFLGCVAGTLLLAGVTADAEFTSAGGQINRTRSWRIDYVFSEKAIKTGDGCVVGWNHAYRSLPVDDPGWDELIDTNGNRPYASGDFSKLFQFGLTD